MTDYIIPEKYQEAFKQTQKMEEDQRYESTTWNERLDRWTQVIDAFFFSGGDSYYCYAPTRTPLWQDEVDEMMDTCSEDGKRVSCVLSTVSIDTDGENTTISFGLAPERRGTEVDDFEIDFSRDRGALNDPLDLDALASYDELVANCIVMKEIIDDGIEPIDGFKELMIAFVARLLFVSNACYFDRDEETEHATAAGRVFREHMRKIKDDVEVNS